VWFVPASNDVAGRRETPLYRRQNALLTNVFSRVAHFIPAIAAISRLKIP
jgi:hypothetical protein